MKTEVNKAGKAGWVANTTKGGGWYALKELLKDVSQSDSFIDGFIFGD